MIHPHQLPNRPLSQGSLLPYPLESHFVQPKDQMKKKRTVPPFLSHLTSETDQVEGKSRYFALSRWERFLGFLICSAGAAACFSLSFFIGLPLLAVKPRKFAVCSSHLLFYPLHQKFELMSSGEK